MSDRTRYDGERRDWPVQIPVPLDLPPMALFLGLCAVVLYGLFMAVAGAA